MAVNTKLPFLDLQSTPAIDRGAATKNKASAPGADGFGQVFSEQMKRAEQLKPRREPNVPAPKPEPREAPAAMDRRTEHGKPAEKDHAVKDTRPAKRPESREPSKETSSEDAETASAVTPEQTAPIAEASQSAGSNAEGGNPGEGEDGKSLPLDAAPLPLFAQINALVSQEMSGAAGMPEEIVQSSGLPPMTQSEFLKLIQKSSSSTTSGVDFTPDDELAEFSLDGLGLDGEGMMKLDELSKLSALSGKSLSLDAKFQLQNLGQALPIDDVRAPTAPSTSLLGASSREPQALLNQYTTSVQTPFHDAKWGEQMINKVVWLTSQNLRSAEIHLNPLDLGPVDVKIQVQQDQTTIQIHAHNPSVREALEQNVNRLREALTGNGLELAQFDVSSQAGQQQSRDPQSGESGALAGQHDGDIDAGADVIAHEQAIELPGLVNTYV